MTPPALNMKIVSDPANLGEARKAIEAFTDGLGMDEEQAGHVILAVDEALTNIIRHAYDNRYDQPIHISVRHDEKEIQVVIRDFGKVVPQEMIHSRDLDDVRPGGLGVHIMHECMDNVIFEHAPEGGTILTMTKLLTPEKGK